MISVIVFAGIPDDAKWTTHLGLPKHLVPVGGQVLLQRTLRQIRCKDPNASVSVVIPNGPCQPLYEAIVSLYARPIPSRYVNGDNGMEPFINTQHLWNAKDRTIILMGDVYFTDQAIDTIWNYLGVFGHAARLTASTVTGCPWGENFGASFLPSEHVRFEQAIEDVDWGYRDKRLSRSYLWEVWQLMEGWAIEDVRVPPRLERLRWHLDIADDGTDDIDFPQDYDNLIARIH